MDVAVVGTGYVGLVAGVCLAELGHNVTCVDKDVDKVQTLAGGHLPIYEGLPRQIPSHNHLKRDLRHQAYGTTQRRTQSSKHPLLI